MTTRAEIVTEAREWIGTRYAHGQSSKGVGCDCYGVAVGIGLALGMPSAIACSVDPACKGYGPQPDPHMLGVAVVKYLDEISLSSAGLGDILLLRFERETHHFAIISRMKPLYVIHAYAAARKVAETPLDGFWRQRVTWKSMIVSAWRYKELTD